MSETFDDISRARFLAIADVLIPEAEGMPSASQAGVGGEVLDRALALRHDLKEDVLRGLNAVVGEAPAASAQRLYESDPSAFAAIGLLAAACYYMIPHVRELVGYPGQERRTYDPDATPEYVKNGALQAVLDRGPIYRPTPGREAARCCAGELSR
jgi:hypothetical protein